MLVDNRSGGFNRQIGAHLDPELGDYAFYVIQNSMAQKLDAARPINAFFEVFSDGSCPRPNLIYYAERHLLAALQRLYGVCELNVEEIYLSVVRFFIKMPRMQWLQVDFQRFSKFNSGSGAVQLFPTAELANLTYLAHIN